MGFLSDLRKVTRTAKKVNRTSKKFAEAAQESREKNLKAKFDRGEISASEFENKFAGRKEGIKVILQDVNGVGESTSEAITREYKDLADLKQTDRERLESIRGVGPSTADAVLDRVQ